MDVQSVILQNHTMAIHILAGVRGEASKRLDELVEFPYVVGGDIADFLADGVAFAAFVGGDADGGGFVGALAVDVYGVGRWAWRRGGC